MCLSLGEKTVDDYLYANGIRHEKEPAYPEGNYRADFAVNGTFIEYVGLKGNRGYDEKAARKQRICAEYGIELVLISPEDLAGAGRLKERLKLVVAPEQRVETFAKAERKTRHEQEELL